VTTRYLQEIAAVSGKQEEKREAGQAEGLWKTGKSHTLGASRYFGIGPLVIEILLVSIFFAACRGVPATDILLKAGDALRKGDVETSLSSYREVTTLYPHSKASQEAFYWIGEIYRLFKKEPKEAIVFFRKTVAEGNLTPFAEKAQQRIAGIYYGDLKDCKKAIPELQTLIDKFPGSKLLAESQYQIGECYLVLGEYEQARIEYQTLLDRYGTSDNRDTAAYRICVTYFRQGDFERAAKEYRRFIMIHPDSPLMMNARFGLVNSLEEMGENEEALNQLVSLEKDYPNREIILRKVDSLLKQKKALEKKQKNRR
jgi:TolA-binding protein